MTDHELTIGEPAPDADPTDDEPDTDTPAPGEHGDEDETPEVVPDEKVGDGDGGT